VTRPRDSLPPHLIRPADVPSWLAGSAIDRIMVHTTTAQDAEQIIHDGVRIDRSISDVGWGHDFYATSRPDPHYGDTPLSVAIRPHQPSVADDSIEGQERIDEMLAAAGSDDVRAVLMEAGYDGVLVHYPDGEMWAVAYDEHQVRIVRY
jgi:hypothetical protein